MSRIKLLLSVGVMGLWMLAMGQEPKTSRMPPGAPAVDGKVAGRFILVQGPPTVEGHLPRTYRLDTMTGRCWVLGNTTLEPPMTGTTDMWFQIWEQEDALKSGLIKSK